MPNPMPDDAVGHAGAFHSSGETPAADGGVDGTGKVFNLGTE
jgi:hypothetical protein